MDKVLLSHKKDFFASINHIKSFADLELFHLLNDEIVLKPVNIPVRDSLYTIELYDSAAARWAPHRVYESGATILGKNFQLQIRESMLSNSELISAIMIIQLLVLILLLIGLAIINRNLSKTIWGPFYIILDRLKKYRIDEDAQLPLPVSTTYEFRELNGAIAYLIERSRTAYREQKEFTENASHELGTPLAICRTKLELLAQTKELTEEQAELVGSLLEATDRISRLNKNLVLLSKIENRQFLESEDIDLLELVMKALEAYKHQTDEKQLSLKCSMTKEAVVRANPTLLELIIFNVISNAIRHTSPGGSVIIEGSKAYFRVSNTGPSLQYPEKIFQRFHRESRSTFGSGLGLSIVKKACEVSSFRIEYSYESGMHSFKVSFSGVLSQ
jgi:signal transduction histidine kinase